jgi:hypothetical protein
MYILHCEAVIFGHQDDGIWVDNWQFVLLPQADGTTRLQTRARTNMVGGAWEDFNRIAFVMSARCCSPSGDCQKGGKPTEVGG